MGRIVVVKDAIQRVIDQRGLKSFNAVAALSGKSPNSLYRIRDGHEMNIRFGTIYEIVQALGMSFSEFFADSDGGSRLMVAGALQHLSEQDRELLLDTLVALAKARSQADRDQLAAAAEGLRQMGNQRKDDTVDR